jgi:hypothetical protein
MSTQSTWPVQKQPSKQRKKYDDEIEKIMMELTKKPLDPLIV